MKEVKNRKFFSPKVQKCHILQLRSVASLLQYFEPTNIMTWPQYRSNIRTVRIDKRAPLSTSELISMACYDEWFKKSG